MARTILEIRERIYGLMGALANMAPEKKQTEQYLAFLSSMNTLAQSVDGLCRKHGTEQDYPKMDTTKMANLLGLYGKAITSGAEFLRTPGTDKITTFRKQAVELISTLLEKDIATLSSLNPELMGSLPKALEQSRVTTVDLTGQKLAKVGANMSVRLPMDILDESGQLISGYFTEECFAKGLEETMEPQYARIRKECPKYAEQLIKFGKSLGEHSFPMVLGTKDAPMYSAKRIVPMIEKHFGSKEAATRAAEDPEFVKALMDYAEYAGNARNSYEINVNGLKFEPGDNIDNRNTAMSIVAGLMGRPELIARSQSLNVKLPDGRTVTGTFMATAQGKDIKNLAENDPLISITRDKLDNPIVNRNMCDLQILDHICGNIDRHAGNIFYQFDDEGKICGFTGIDNDASFPNLEFEPNRAGFENMAKLDLDFAISEEAAHKILNLTGDVLRMALAGTRLSASQIDFAVKRLEQVQNRIQADIEYFRDKEPTALEEGHIHIIRDEDWAKIPLKDLALTKSGKEELARGEDPGRGSIHGSPLGRLFNLKKFALGEYEVSHRKLGEQKKAAPQARVQAQDDAIVNAKAVYKSEVKIQKSELALQLEALEQNDPFYIRSSSEFREMKKATIALNNQLKEMPAEPSNEQLMALRDSYNKVADLSEMYIQMKSNQSKIGQRGQSRLQLSMVLNTSMVQQYEKLNKVLGVQTPNRGQIADGLKERATQVLSNAKVGGAVKAADVKRAVATLIVSEIVRNKPDNERYNSIMAEKQIKTLSESKRLAAFLKTTSLDGLMQKIQTGGAKAIRESYQAVNAPKAAEPQPGLAPKAPAQDGPVQGGPNM